MNTASSLEQLSALATRSFSSHEEAIDTVLQSVSEILEMHTSFLSNISRQENRLTLIGAHSSSDGFALASGMRLPLSQTFCDMIANGSAHTPLMLEDVYHNQSAQAHACTKTFSDVGSYIGVPVTLTDGTFFGTLCAIDVQTRAHSPSDSSLMLILARMLATQIERERELNERYLVEGRLHQAHTKLRVARATMTTLAVTDPVTHLLNHRAILSTLDRTFARTRKMKENCAVCFVDLDHFKAVNETYGHAAGDVVLHEVGQLMRQHMRQDDAFGRWGGEEFIAVLSSIPESEALDVAERLRSAIAEHIFPIGSGIRMTASLGIAVAPLHADDCSSLMDAADKAMCTARRFGRNQVRSASDVAVALCGQEEVASTSYEDFSLAGTVEALAFLVDARDKYTGEHTLEVSDLVLQLTEVLRLGADEVSMLGIAARLHDIGKVAIPDAILNKPGKLDPEEWLIMQRHAEVGAEIVSHVPSLRTLVPIIRSHHERWDGCGYPDRLVGEQIPLGSRIIAVVDSYNAMTTNRPYRKASSPEWAFAELRRCAGLQFDPLIVESFAQLIEQESALMDAEIALS
jgi:diguanylate cyclase (GGDEF)-like protein/putative nucleotidyltransferase with HDIG domain